MTDAAVRTYLYLLFCGANNVSAEREILETADLDAVYPLARANGLSAFVGRTLEESGIRHARFHHDRDYALRRQIILDSAAAEVTDLLEQHGISYVPLKGMFLKDTYPSFGTREMGDLDILIDPRGRKSAGDALITAGYSRDDIDPGYHDSYRRDDILVELHVRPLDAALTPAWKSFIKDLPLRAVNESGRPMTAGGAASREDGGCRCRLAPRDHYIYLLAHAYKHSLSTGIGLRFLLDLWLMRRAFPGEISLPEVRSGIAAMRLAGFEKESADLADLLFGTGIKKAVLSEAQEMLLTSFLTGGVCGEPGASSRIILEMNAARGQGLLRAYAHALRVLGDNEEWYALHSPFVYRHKWARPFYVLGLGTSILKKDPAHALHAYGAGKRKKG